MPIPLIYFGFGVISGFLFAAKEEGSRLTDTI